MTTTIRLRYKDGYRAFDHLYSGSPTQSTGSHIEFSMDARTLSAVDEKLEIEFTEFLTTVLSPLESLVGDLHSYHIVNGVVILRGAFSQSDIRTTVSQSFEVTNRDGIGEWFSGTISDISWEGLITDGTVIYVKGQSQETQKEELHAVIDRLERDRMALVSASETFALATKGIETATFAIGEYFPDQDEAKAIGMAVNDNDVSYRINSVYSTAQEASPERTRKILSDLIDTDEISTSMDGRVATAMTTAGFTGLSSALMSYAKSVGAETEE